MAGGSGGKDSTEELQDNKTEENAIQDAFWRMKLSSSKPRPQPPSATEQDQKKRSKKRSRGRSALDQSDDQQNSDTSNAKESSHNEGRNKKICSPSSSPPPSTATRQGRGRRRADSNNEFNRSPKGFSFRRLWEPSNGSLSRSSQFKYKAKEPALEVNAEEDDWFVENSFISQLIQKPETRLISQKQLVAEVEGKYAGLVTIYIKDFSSGETEFYVDGRVNETDVEALPDTGAEACFISQDLTSRLGLHAVPGSQKSVILANGKAVRSPGMVEVPWEFSNEEKTHPINCWILPGCARPLVLGNHFLQITRTLGEFCHRIKCRRLRAPNQCSLNFLGNQKPRLRGYLNGHLATALPDTGSDAMFINGAYARRIGLDVDYDVETHVQVQLADGSTTMTSGIVRNADWKVGRTTVQCNFYVLKNLHVNIILSNNYLFEMNIFSEQHEHLFESHSKDSKDYPLGFCILRLVKKKRVISTYQEVEQLEKKEELYRRDKIRDEIMALPKDQQGAAAQAENARQKLWEAQKPEREAKQIAELHIVTGNVQNNFSRGSQWGKKVSVGFFYKGIKVIIGTRQP
ncbi:hypothetical protein V8C34DRAFT_286289 [Trichoderma compactum]